MKKRFYYFGFSLLTFSFLTGCSNYDMSVASDSEMNGNKKTNIEISSEKIQQINSVSQPLINDIEKSKKSPNKTLLLKKGDESKPDKSPQLSQPKLPESLKQPEKAKAKATEVPSKKNQNQREKPALPKYSPNIKAPSKLQHPLDNATKLSFMLGEDSQGKYLYGEGPITQGAFKKFKRYVDHYAKKGISLNRLMLHSPGGLVNEGLMIGEYIQDNQWTTDADKYMKCYSSCGFIYASGVNKRIQDGAEIGFHRPYIPSKSDTPEFIEQVYNDYKPYWSYIDGSPELYNKFMQNYGRDDMYILNDKSIQKYMKVEQY